MHWFDVLGFLLLALILAELLLLGRYWTPLLVCWRCFQLGRLALLVVCALLHYLPDVVVDVLVLLGQPFLGEVDKEWLLVQLQQLWETPGLILILFVVIVQLPSQPLRKRLRRRNCRSGQQRLKDYLEDV